MEQPEKRSQAETAQVERFHLDASGLDSGLGKPPPAAK